MGKQSTDSWKVVREDPNMDHAYLSGTNMSVFFLENPLNSYNPIEFAENMTIKCGTSTRSTPHLQGLVLWC